MPKMRMLLERQNMINIPTAIQNKINPTSRFKVASRRYVVISKICRRAYRDSFGKRKKEFHFGIKSAII